LVDFNHTMKEHLPLVFSFVLGLAFLLLLLSFRSVVITTMTIVLNLLSVGAAYGVMVLVFQDRHWRSLLGAQDVGGDRLNTAVLARHSLRLIDGLPRADPESDPRGARAGSRPGLQSPRLTSTAGVITSAALLMVAVFSIFATMSEISFKLICLALAAAVLIDATIVRIVLLPSLMTLLGRWNWYLPGWLGFLARRPPPAPEPEPESQPEPEKVEIAV
jgi:putative drug exporter of the RND superfamily